MAISQVVSCVLLTLSVTGVPLAVARDNSADRTNIYASVISAEMRAANLAPKQRICLSLEGQAAPTKALQQSLKARGIRILRGGSNCFRKLEYVVSIQRVTFFSGQKAEVLVKTADSTMSEVDFGVILRHGTYLLDDASGEWKVVEYRKRPIPRVSQ